METVADPPARLRLKGGLVKSRVDHLEILGRPTLYQIRKKPMIDP